MILLIPGVVLHLALKWRVSDTPTRQLKARGKAYKVGNFPYTALEELGEHGSRGFV